MPTVTSATTTTTTTHKIVVGHERQIQTTIIHIYLIGDSDIEYWPNEILPSLSILHIPNSTVTIHKEGYCGATLQKIIPQINNLIHTRILQPIQHNPSTETIKVINYNYYFIVVCGGENDIGQNIPLSDTKTSMEVLIHTIYNTNQTLLYNTWNNSSKCKSSSSCNESIQQQQQHPQLYLLFIRPKLEPWLQYDIDTRKQYIRLSYMLQHVACNTITHIQDDDDDNNNHNDIIIATAMNRRRRQQQQNVIHYINCLTMFCNDDGYDDNNRSTDPMNCNCITNTTHVLSTHSQQQQQQKHQQHSKKLDPCTAIPNPMYFHSDQLHLSHIGYQLWKSMIEETIYSIIGIKFG